jgi:hypothetical protein
MSASDIDPVFLSKIVLLPIAQFGTSITLIRANRPVPKIFLFPTISSIVVGWPKRVIESLPDLRSTSLLERRSCTTGIAE